MNMDEEQGQERSEWVKPVLYRSTSAILQEDLVNPPVPPNSRPNQPLSRRGNYSHRIRRESTETMERSPRDTSSPRRKGSFTGILVRSNSSEKVKDKDKSGNEEEDKKSASGLLETLKRKTRGFTTSSASPDVSPTSSSSNLNLSGTHSTTSSSAPPTQVTDTENIQEKMVYIDVPINPDCDPSVDMWGVPDLGNILMAGSEHHYQIRAATIGKLVERLTLTFPNEIKQHIHYKKVFFMTYRSIAKGEVIFDKLAQRFFGPQNISPEEAETWEIPLTVIRQNTCVAIKEWVQDHYKDFRANNGVLTQKLQDFIRDASKLDEKSQGLVSFLDGVMQKKLNRGTYQSLFSCSVMLDKSSAPDPIVPKSMKGVTFMDLDELEIARQLTIGEYHIYAEIQPVELQDLAWSKASLKDRAPNVLSMITRFNHFSESFATMIVSEPKIKLRRKIVEKFVRITEHLMVMNSFNMVMAIMSGFGNSAVYRMKHTFSSLNKKTQETLERLDEVLSSNNSYKAYREMLSSVDPPAIPFLGVYLSDLTFVDEGNPDKIDGLMNFRKRALEYDVIVQVLKFQDHNYHLHMVPGIVKILEDLPRLDEKEMYNLSLQHEPRNARKKDLK